MNKKSIDDVLSRLMYVFDIKTDSELARKMGVNRQTLASWRSRNSVPYALCINISEQEGVDLAWLLTGKETDSDCTEQEEDSVSLQERKWLEMFRKLDEDAQKNILADIEKEQRLQSLEREVWQLKELKKTIEQLKKTG